MPVKLDYAGMCLHQYEITPEQTAFLKSLRCERLSEDIRNLRDVETFSNYRNETIVDTLKGEAFGDDEGNIIAYYIVKDSDSNILCFFSLKAGLLFNKHGELEILQSKKKLNRLLKKRGELYSSTNAMTSLQKDIEKEINDIRNNLKRWIELDEEDDKHKRVGKTFAGIEIVHFCINEKEKDNWRKIGLGDKNRIGLTIFWDKIIPIVLNVQKLIGAEFLYLFAADSTEDRLLINHYKTFMGMEEPTDIYAALPIYDSGCTLLCRNINELKEEQINFYKNFNLTEEETI